MDLGLLHAESSLAEVLLTFVLGPKRADTGYSSTASQRLVPMTALPSYCDIVELGEELGRLNLFVVFFTAYYGARDHISTGVPTNRSDLLGVLNIRVGLPQGSLIKHEFCFIILFIFLLHW